jgi:hypothetical protein
MSLFEISHGERAAWQRRAAAELARILAAHPDLPLIAWTVGPTGAALLGRVKALVPPAEARQVFDLWRAAVALAEPVGTRCADGTVYLRAVAERHGVRLGLAATVFSYSEGEG